MNDYTVEEKEKVIEQLRQAIKDSIPIQAEGRKEYLQTMDELIELGVYNKEIYAIMKRNREDEIERARKKEEAKIARLREKNERNKEEDEER